MKILTTPKTLEEFHAQGFYTGKIYENLYLTELRDIYASMPKGLTRTQEKEWKHLARRQLKERQDGTVYVRGKPKVLNRDFREPPPIDLDRHNRHILLPENWHDTSASIGEFLNYLKLIGILQQATGVIFYLPLSDRMQFLNEKSMEAALGPDVYFVSTPEEKAHHMIQTASPFTWYVRFKYNRDFVDKFKQHAPQRRWNPKDKTWSFVSADKNEIRTLIQKLNVNEANVAVSLEFSQDKIIWQSWENFI